MTTSPLFNTHPIALYLCILLALLLLLHKSYQSYLEWYKLHHDRLYTTQKNKAISLLIAKLNDFQLNNSGILASHIANLKKGKQISIQSQIILDLLVDMLDREDKLKGSPKHLFHRYSPWSDVEINKNGQGVQLRSCVLCNKLDIRFTN